MREPFKSSISKLFEQIAANKKCREILERENPSLAAKPELPKWVEFDLKDNADIARFEEENALKTTPFGKTPEKKQGKIRL
jgi:hypothetical protein